METEKPARRTRIQCDVDSPGMKRWIVGISIMTPILCLAVLSLLAVPATAGVPVLAGPVVSPVNGHHYYLLGQSDWFAAEREARALGGHLATIRDEEENAWLYETFGAFGGSPRHLWIGLFDEGRDQFGWVSGEPVGFTHWCPPQPDHADGREHYGHMVAPRYCAWGGWWNAPRRALITASGYAMHGVVEVELVARYREGDGPSPSIPLRPGFAAPALPSSGAGR
jgi:hypothetical protein